MNRLAIKGICIIVVIGLIFWFGAAAIVAGADFEDLECEFINNTKYTYWKEHIPSILMGDEYIDGCDYCSYWQIFCWLRARGYSSAVCCGIIGNIMAEVGYTSDYQCKWYIYDKSGTHYGLCQWALKYVDIGEAGYTAQLMYLVGSMEREFTTFGGNYKTGFSFNNFCNLTSPEEAADAFAKCYERCAASKYNYELRRKNARTAWNLFVYENAI